MQNKIFLALTFLLFFICQPVMAAEETPDIVMARYLDSLQQDRPDTSLYSKSSQKLASIWAANTGGAAQEAKILKECGTGETKTNGDYAVIRFPRKPLCPPYFFVYQDSTWSIDLNVMTVAIISDPKGWHFLGDPHDLPYYDFAFKDWAFDEKGYPL